MKTINKQYAFSRAYKTSYATWHFSVYMPFSGTNHANMRATEAIQQLVCLAFYISANLITCTWYIEIKSEICIQRRNAVCLRKWIDRGYLIFQCKIEFYFTAWTPKAVFSRVAVATSDNTGFGIHEWHEIRSYTEKKKKKKKKKKQIFCFILFNLFTIIKLLPTLRLSRQKTFFLAISCQFGLFGVFRRYSIGWKHSFAPRKWDQIAFKAIQHKKSAQT